MSSKSEELFHKAQAIIPGGVNSPVRAGRNVGVDPPFIQRADGCYLWDVDGKRYIDYVCSWGPMILGHRHPAVIQALSDALENGTSYGAPTELEVALAEMIIEAVPSIEMVRMVNSGTEATMSAIRLARGFTGRNMIISSTAAITDTPTVAWFRPAQDWLRLASLEVQECRPSWRS